MPTNRNKRSANKRTKRSATNSANKRSANKRTKRSANKRTKRSATNSASNRKSGGYTKAQTKRIIKRQNKSHKKASRLTNSGTLKCPAGQIKRSAYMRKSKSGKKTAVAARCIRNVGKPGKAKRTMVIENKNFLERYGYDDVKDLSKAQREKALEKAVDAYGYVKVIRRLGAVAALQTRTNPKDSKIFRNDQHMVSKWYKEAFL